MDLPIFHIPLRDFCLKLRKTQSHDLKPHKQTSLIDTLVLMYFKCPKNVKPPFGYPNKTNISLFFRLQKMTPKFQDARPAGDRLQ